MFVILCVVYCFECVCVRVILCIAVPLPPGIYPLAVNNNSNKNNKERKNKCDTSNNRGNRNHFKSIQKIPEQDAGKP